MRRFANRFAIALRGGSFGTIRCFLQALVCEAMQLLAQMRTPRQDSMVAAGRLWRMAPPLCRGNNLNDTSLVHRRLALDQPSGKEPLLRLQKVLATEKVKPVTVKEKVTVGATLPQDVEICDNSG